jgi:hypothetical protein
MQIKIFVIHSTRLNTYDDYEIRLGEGVSDWETVTDDEFKFIKSNLYMLNRERYPNDTLVLVSKDDVKPSIRIEGIKKMITDTAKAVEQRKAEDRKRREEAAAKRAAQKQTREQKKLLKMIEENPELVKDILSVKK